MFCFGLRFVLQTVLIQVANVDFIIPRRGGRRDREGFANPSLPLQHLSTHPGESAAAGLIAADREGLGQYSLVQVWLAGVVCDSGFFAWLLSFVFHLC